MAAALTINVPYKCNLCFWKDGCKKGYTSQNAGTYDILGKQIAGIQFSEDCVGVNPHNDEKCNSKSRQECSEIEHGFFAQKKNEGKAKWQCEWINGSCTG